MQSLLSYARLFNETYYVHVLIVNIFINVRSSIIIHDNFRGISMPSITAFQMMIKRKDVPLLLFNSCINRLAANHLGIMLLDNHVFVFVQEESSSSRFKPLTSSSISVAVLRSFTKRFPLLAEVNLEILHADTWSKMKCGFLPLRCFFRHLYNRLNCYPTLLHLFALRLCVLTTMPQAISLKCGNDGFNAHNGLFVKAYLSF